MFFCIGAGEATNLVYLRELGEAANDGKSIIKVGKEKISDVVIEDRNFTANWADIFDNLSCSVN